MFELRSSRLLRLSSMAVSVCFAACLAGGIPASAQVKPGVTGSFLKRFDFGARGSILIHPTVETGASYTLTEDPYTYTYYTSSGLKNRFGGGPTVQVYLTRKLALSVDLFYRRSGYLKATDIEVGDPSDLDVTIEVTNIFERTRVGLWDVPVLFRYYPKPLDHRGPWFYMLGGPTFRRATSTSSFNEVYNPDGTIDTNTDAAVIQHKNVTGGTVGVGLQIMDDYGFKMMPEFRFTRWFANTFDVAPARSAKNQFEIVFGIVW